MWLVESKKHNSDDEHGEMNEIESFIEPATEELQSCSKDYIKGSEGDPAINLVNLFQLCRVMSYHGCGGVGAIS